MRLVRTAPIALAVAALAAGTGIGLLGAQQHGGVPVAALVALALLSGIQGLRAP